MPRSGVCLNHEGSLEPSERAISVLETDSSAAGVEGAGVEDLEAGLSGEAKLRGRRPADELGRRCCHETVLERERDDVCEGLGAALVGAAVSSCAGSVPTRRDSVSRCDMCRVGESMSF